MFQLLYQRHNCLAKAFHCLRVSNHFMFCMLCRYVFLLYQTKGQTRRRSKPFKDKPLLSLLYHVYIRKNELGSMTILYGKFGKMAGSVREKNAISENFWANMIIKEKKYSTLQSGIVFENGQSVYPFLLNLFLQCKLIKEMKYCLPKHDY